jgi:hypothetical protein
MRFFYKKERFKIEKVINLWLTTFFNKRRGALLSDYMLFDRFLIGPFVVSMRSSVTKTASVNCCLYLSRNHLHFSYRQSCNKKPLVNSCFF